MIYFDNMASTKVCKEAQEAQNKIDNELYANPSALSKFGVMAEEEIKKATNIISNGLKVNNDEIVFTSTATESNNLFLKGVAYRNKRLGNHIISQKSEHPSVLEPLKKLEEDGFEVTYLDVDANGNIDLNQLKDSLKETTILVSIMHVNNLTGTIMPIEELTKIVKAYNKNIKVHIDGVQSFAKYDINLNKLGIDGYSFSGHKIHAPKGIAGLYIKKGTNIQSEMLGGSQQNKLRAGTMNTGGIVALAKAFEVSCKTREESYKNAVAIKEELLTLRDKVEGVFVNGDLENSSPYVLNLSFADVRGEVLLHALSDYDICISAGTSCSVKAKSGVLAEYGFDEDRIMGSVRIGTSRYNTLDEAKEFVKRVEELIPMLRRFKRR